jgi:rSAM/selenodomain-associated transferase 1
VNAERLIVFLRAPRLGTVKTRLAAGIGAEGALAIYRELVNAVLEVLRDFENVELRFTPDDAAAEIGEWRRPVWTIAAQGKGDLGERMDRAFREHSTVGMERVVIIGTDCPEISPAEIREAFENLRGFDVVLGPARDGGYWLIGLKAPYEPLFRNIPWSTGEVLRITLQRAAELGLTTALLTEKSDIDTAEDWFAFERARKAVNSAS